MHKDFLPSAESIGQQIEVTVENERAGRRGEIKVTMLPQVELPFGTKLTGTVTGFNQAGALLDVDRDLPAFLHVSKIQEDYLDSPKDVLAIGQQVEVRIEGGDEREIKVTMLPSAS